MKKIHPIIEQIHNCLQQDVSEEIICKELDTTYLPGFAEILSAETNANTRLQQQKKKPFAITADINAIIARETALTLACKKGYSMCIPLLLQACANVNTKNANGNTPIGMAIAAENLLCIIALFSRYTDGEAFIPKLDTIAYHHGITNQPVFPMQLAALKGNIEILKSLIESGAALDLVDPDGNTLLHYAARNNQNDGDQCIKQLIDANIEVNASNKAQNTALHLAAAIGAEKSVGILLAHGANGAALNQKQATPVFIACQYGQPACLNQLLASIPEDKLKTVVNKEAPVKYKNSVRNESPLRVARNFMKKSPGKQQAARNCIFLLLIAGTTVNEFEKEKLAQSKYKKILCNQLIKKSKEIAKESIENAIAFLEEYSKPENNFGKIMWHESKSTAGKAFGEFASRFQKKTTAQDPKETNDIQLIHSEIKKLKSEFQKQQQNIEPPLDKINITPDNEEIPEIPGFKIS